MRNYFTIPPGVILIFAFEIAMLKAQSTLYVKERSGSQSSYPLTEMRKIDFSAGSLSVTKNNGAAQTIALNDLRLLSFKNYFLGIPDPGSVQNNTIKLYPNPVNNTLQIEYSGDNKTGYILEIHDIQGHRIQQNLLRSKTVSIDVTNLKAGVYLCHIQDQSGVTDTKFIKN
jgi:hypothetical protein